MGWEQDVINTLYEYYETDTSTTKDIWVTNPKLHNFVRQTFIKEFYFNPDDEHDSLAHFEFLRHIMYTICNYIENDDYLNFITRILITILEDGNGISKEHHIWNTTKLYNLVKLPEVLYYFEDKDDAIIKLSNGRVKAFIEAILDGKIDKTICIQMKQIIDSNTRRVSSSRSRVSRVTSSTDNKLGEGHKKRTTRRHKKRHKKKDKKRRTKK